MIHASFLFAFNPTEIVNFPHDNFSVFWSWEESGSTFSMNFDDVMGQIVSKYYLQLHLRLFVTSNGGTHVLRSYFCYFPRGGNDFRTHTFPTTAVVQLPDCGRLISRVGGARPYVKCCCSRRRRRLNNQFISSLGCKVQSGSTKLRVETAMPSQVVGFLRFH